MYWKVGGQQENTMSDEAKRYWFPAKRCGWGWGLPATWQGWAILISWIAVLVPTSAWLAPRSTLLFILFLVIMVVAIIAICCAKGEPPCWRWGDDRPAEKI
jgi:hypothetical protein